MTHPRDINCDEGRVLRLSPGLLYGALELSAFTDPQMSVDQSGFTQLRFRFRDERGDAWEHTNVLSPYHFWPLESQSLHVAPRPQTWGYGFMASLDDREQVRLRLDTGECIDVHRKYTAFTCRLSGVDGAESVSAHAEIGLEHPLADRGSLGVLYDVSVVELLWRPGPVLVHGDVLIEDADHVVLHSAAVTEGIPASAAHVAEA